MTSRSDPFVDGGSTMSTMSLPKLSSGALHIQLLEEGFARRKQAKERAHAVKERAEDAMRQKKAERMELERARRAELKEIEDLKGDQDLKWATEGLDLYLTQSIGPSRNRKERQVMIKEGVGEMNKVRVGKPEQMWASTQERMNSSLRDERGGARRKEEVEPSGSSNSHFSGEKYLKQITMEKKIRAVLEGNKGGPGLGGSSLPRLANTGAQTMRTQHGEPRATSGSLASHLASPRPPPKKVPDPLHPWRMVVQQDSPAYMRLSNPQDVWRRPVMTEQVEQRIALIANDDIAVRQQVAKTLDFTHNTAASMLRKCLGIVMRLIYTHLGGAERDQLVTAINRLVELREEASGAFIKDVDVDDVAKVMWIHPGLETLNLSGNLVRERGSGILASAISASPKLKTVNLSGNPIGARGTRALAGALHDNGTLTALSLNLCDTRDEGAVALADALIYNKFLRSLDLSGNHIGDVGCCAIAECLKKAGGNRTLEHLDLSHNIIHAQGAHSVAGIMKINRKLVWLDLFDNAINDTAAVHLAQSVVQYATLRTFSSLDLADLRHDKRVSMYMRCGPAGAHIVAHFLGSAARLKRLDFTNNKLDDKAVRSLMEALRENKSLESLDIRGNDDQYVIPREVVESGGTKVVDIMRDAIESGSNQLLRMKWMLLGRGEAGKSSLFQTLRSGTTQLTAREARTVGTDIEQFKPSENSPVSVSVWDCGGQGVYWRVGNTMYLTEQRTLYLIVFDLSCSPPISGLQEKAGLFKEWTEDNEMQWVRFWVRLLLLHAPRSVVTLVGTKADLIDPATKQRRMERAKSVFLDTIAQQRKSLQRRMNATQIKLNTVKRSGGDEKAEEFLVGVMDKLKRLLMYQPVLAGDVQAVSCKELKTIEAVRSHLIASMDDLNLFPDLKNVIPRTWSDLLHGVEAMVQSEDTPPSMSWYDFRELMMTKFFADNDDAESSFMKAVSFLHSTGTLLHLGTPGSSDEIVVLRPQWLVDVIKQVIRHDFNHINRDFPAVKHLVAQLIKKGELHNMLLRVLWSSKVLGHSVDPALHEHLVRVMCQFEVLMPYSDEAFLVPCFFPETAGGEFQWHLWPSSQAGGELVMGWAVTIHPSPSGLFENTLGTSTKDFKLMPGAYRRDVRGSLADGVEAGALLISRRNATRILLRVDPRTVLVVARIARREDGDNIDDERVALAVELATFLSLFKTMCEHKYPGACELSVSLLCPSCLSRPDILNPAKTCDDFLAHVGQWETSDMAYEMEEVRKTNKDKLRSGGGGGEPSRGGGALAKSDTKAMSYEQFVAARAKDMAITTNRPAPPSGPKRGGRPTGGGGDDDENGGEHRKGAPGCMCHNCAYELPARLFRPFEIVAGHVEVPQEIDVYLSYRMLCPGEEVGAWTNSSDRAIASVLYERLGERLVNTFWDVRSVGAQENMTERIVEAIMEASIFCPIISRNTMVTLIDMRKDMEEVDNIVMEYIIALELMDMRLMDAIVPVFNLGGQTGIGNMRMDSLPDFVPEKTIHKAWKCIESYLIPRGIRQGVPYPQRRTIKQVFKQVVAHGREADPWEEGTSLHRLIQVDLKSLVANEIKLQHVISQLENASALDQISQVVRIVKSEREKERKAAAVAGLGLGDGADDPVAKESTFAARRRLSAAVPRASEVGEGEPEAKPSCLSTALWAPQMSNEVGLGVAVELLMLGDKSVQYKEHLAASILMKCGEWPGPGQTAGKWEACTGHFSVIPDPAYETHVWRTHEGVMIKEERDGRKWSWAIAAISSPLADTDDKVTLMVQVGETAVVAAVRAPRRSWAGAEEVAGIGLRMAMEETQRYLSRHVPQMLTARRILCPHCLMAPDKDPPRMSVPMQYTQDLASNIGVWEITEFTDDLHVQNGVDCPCCSNQIVESPVFAKLQADIDTIVTTSAKTLDVYVSTYGAFFVKQHAAMVQTLLDELDKATLQAFYDPPGDSRLMLASRVTAGAAAAGVGGGGDGGPMRDKARDSIKSTGRLAETFASIERASVFMPVFNQGTMAYMGESAKRNELDHVILELVLAVELHRAGRLQVIWPVFTDGKLPRPGVETAEKLPVHVVKAANAALSEMGLKGGVTTKTTVRAIIDQVMTFDGTVLPPTPDGILMQKDIQAKTSRMCERVREIRAQQKKGSFTAVGGAAEKNAAAGSCSLVMSRHHIPVKRKLLCDILHSEMADKGIPTFSMPADPAPNSSPADQEAWINEFGRAIASAQVYMPMLADSTIEAVVRWVKGKYTETMCWPMVEYVAALELARRGKIHIQPMLVDHAKSQKQMLRLPKELLDIEMGPNIMNVASKAVGVAMMLQGVADAGAIPPKMSRRVINDIIEQQPYILPVVEDGRGKQFRSALQGAVSLVQGKVGVSNPKRPAAPSRVGSSSRGGTPKGGASSRSRPAAA